VLQHQVLLVCQTEFEASQTTMIVITIGSRQSQQPEKTARKKHRSDSTHPQQSLCMPMQKFRMPVKPNSDHAHSHSQQHCGCAAENPLKMAAQLLRAQSWRAKKTRMPIVACLFPCSVQTWTHHQETFTRRWQKLTL